jgi:hypothetical protein
MNLVEILKDVPRGTKLYSPIFGEVEFFAIDEYSSYPIIVEARDNYGNKYSKTFTKEGFYSINYSEGEQLLFPSEKNRDWSTFKLSKPDLPFYTPCICFDDIRYGVPHTPELRYYAGHGLCYYSGKITGPGISWKYIIPIKKYDFENRTFDNKDNYGKYDEKDSTYE